MKSEEWITVTLEVPLHAIKFDDCGDGDKEIYGLKMARLPVKGLPLPFTVRPDDIERAEAKMHDWLGTSRPDPDARDEEAHRNLARMAEHSRRMREIAEQERQAHFDDPLSKRRA